ncbi:MAG: hypothetical protein NTW52_20120 [Planctomycetota bacterium]|nr:hypothetical protein [Planctomycetota bacterium]
MVYTDFYTLDEFSLSSGVSRCFFRTSKLPSSGNYESHQPCTQPLSRRSNVPVGRREIGFDGYDGDFQTARYAYALKVVEAAHTRTLAKYPDWLGHEWVMVEPGWRKIVFSSKQRIEAEDYCDSQIREIADSGKVVITESVRIESGTRSKKLTIVKNVPELDEALVDTLMSQMQSGAIPPNLNKEFSFRYEEIARHIVWLDDRLLSLLNGHDGMVPLSEADKSLFEAAATLDRLGMESALSRGASLSALDNGESVLTEVIQSYSSAERDFSHEDRKATAEWLVEKGVDCNLFGFEGVSPLTAAVLRHDPVLVRYLLSKGADPESDQFPDEHYYPEPTASYYASGDLHCVDEGTPEYVDVWEINVLIDVAIIEKQQSQGRSLQETLTYTPENRIWVNRVDAVYVIALAWNRRDANILEPFVTDDIVYQTEHLFEWVQGKSAVIEYLQNKMRLLPEDEPEAKTFAELCVNNEWPCILISRGLKDDLASTIVAESKEGLITRLDVSHHSLDQFAGRRVGLLPR